MSIILIDKETETKKVNNLLVISKLIRCRDGVWAHIIWSQSQFSPEHQSQNLHQAQEWCLSPFRSL